MISPRVNDCTSIEWMNIAKLMHLVAKFERLNFVTTYSFWRFQNANEKMDEEMTIYMMNEIVTYFCDILMDDNVGKSKIITRKEYWTLIYQNGFMEFQGLEQQSPKFPLGHY